MGMLKKRTSYLNSPFMKLQKVLIPIKGNSTPMKIIVLGTRGFPNVRAGSKPRKPLSTSGQPRL